MGHILCSINLKIGMNVCLDEMFDEFGSPGSHKLCQKIPCGCSRGHSFWSIDLKTGKNMCLDEISDELKFQSPWGHKISH